MLHAINRYDYKTKLLYVVLFGLVLFMLSANLLKAEPCSEDSIEKANGESCLWVEHYLKSRDNAQSQEINYKRLNDTELSSSLFIGLQTLEEQLAQQAFQFQAFSDDSPRRVENSDDKAVIDASKALFIRDPFGENQGFTFDDMMNQLAESLPNAGPSNASPLNCNHTGNDKDHLSVSKNITGLDLFRDWWRTALPTNSSRSECAAISCHQMNISEEDFKAMDFRNPHNTKIINQLTYTCPFLDGMLGNLPRISDDKSAGKIAPFNILAVVNRTDLKPLLLTKDGLNLRNEDGTCGEFRIIVGEDVSFNRDFSRSFKGYSLDNPLEWKLTDNKSIPKGHFLFSFEFAPLFHGEGAYTNFDICKAVQKFWYNLSNKSEVEIAKALKQFFFLKNKLTLDGQLLNDERDYQSSERVVATFEPIVHYKNLGAPDENNMTRGQVRTNTKVVYNVEHEESKWMRREYQFRDVSGFGFRLIPVALNNVLASDYLQDENVDSLAKAQQKIQGIKGMDTSLNAKNLVDSRINFEDRTLAQSEQQELAYNYEEISTGFQKYFENFGDEKSRFRNLKFNSCSGCHNEMKFKDIKPLLKNSLSALTGLQDRHKLADQNHVRFSPGDSSLAVSNYLQCIALPLRCEIMKQYLSYDNLNGTGFRCRSIPKRCFSPQAY